MQPRAYRCRTASDHFRDFLCAVALHIVQPHRDSLIVRQCVYRLPQLTAAFRFRNSSIWAAASIGAVRLNHAERRRSSAERYAQQPCFQMLDVAEIGVVPQQPEKDLIDVLCVRGCSVCTGQAVDRVAAGDHRLLQKCVRPEFCLHCSLLLSPPTRFAVANRSRCCRIF